MPRVVTNQDALRASVAIEKRARYADGKPIERVKPPEPPAPVEPPSDRLADAVADIKQALEAFAAQLAAKGPGQSPAPVVNMAPLVDLLTRVASNTEPRQVPEPKAVRFRVIERDEKGRVLVFEVEK